MRVSIWSSVMKPESRAVRLASSEKPMLVGEVRCATRATGCSCTLSGGRWLSSAPTKVSKNAQVRRATRRRKRRCVGAELAARLRQRAVGPPDDQRREQPQQQQRRGGGDAPTGARAASRAAISTAAVGPAHSARMLSRSAAIVPGAWPCADVGRRPSIRAGGVRAPCARSCARSRRAWPRPRWAGRRGCARAAAAAARCGIRRRGDGDAVDPVDRRARQAHHVGGERHDADDHDDAQRPHERLGQPRPAEHRQRDQRRGHEAAAQVVEQLPLRQRRQRIARRARQRVQAAAQPADQLPVAAHPAVAARHVGAVARRACPRAAARRDSRPERA